METGLPATLHPGRNFTLYYFQKINGFVAFSSCPNQSKADCLSNQNDYDIQNYLPGSDGSPSCTSDDPTCIRVCSLPSVKVADFFIREHFACQNTTHYPPYRLFWAATCENDTLDRLPTMPARCSENVRPFARARRARAAVPDLGRAAGQHQRRRPDHNIQHHGAEQACAACPRPPTPITPCPC